MCERAIRTVKAKLYTILRGQVTNQWDLYNGDVIDALNKTYNSAVGCTPTEANSLLNVDTVRRNLERNLARRTAAESKKYGRLKEPEFAIGTYVYADYKRDGLRTKESSMQRGQVSYIYV